MRGTTGIAIPAYGRGRHLTATLESALAQTRAPEEVIVVDDCSPDETGTVAGEFESRGVACFRNEKNLGVPANYNEALGRTTADYVMLLEDHDLLEPTFIERCAGLLDEHPDVGLVACAIAEIEEKTGRTLRVFEHDFPPVLEGRRLAERLVTRIDAPFGLVVLIRRKALEGLEPWFDPRYWWYADIHLWIRLALRSSFGYVREPLLRMRRREEGHYLEDRAWEGLVCCDRIRRDHWPAVFPLGGVRPRLKWLRYAAERDYDALTLALSDLAHGRPAVPRSALAMFTSPGRAAAKLLAWAPRPLALAVRALHHRLVPRV